MVGTIVAALGLAAVFTALVTPTYESTSTSRLVTRPSDLTTGIGVDSIEYEDRLANTYRQILENGETADWLAGELGVEPGEAPGVAVTLPANSQLIEITVTDPDAGRASEAADLLASRLAEDIATPGTVATVEAARTPGAPASPSWPLNLALAGVVGLLAGVALALVLERPDRRVRDADAIEAVAGVPVLAEIPAGSAFEQTIVNSGSPQEEAFRGLPSTITAGERLTPLRTLLCSGIEDGPATAAVVANLAVAFSNAGRSVVAVDADLREPRLHRLFGLPNEGGLGDVLADGLEPVAALQRSRHGVSVLTAGQPGDGERASSSSSQTLDVIERLADRFDLVLVSSHSLLAAADARILAPAVDGVVMVVPRGAAHQAAMRRATRQLALLGVRPIGLVLADRGRSGSLSERLRSAVWRPAR